MKVRHSEKMKRNVSVLGFGGWQLGNSEHWGEMSFNEGKNLVRDAFALGITFFDTAPNYSNGLSEEIIGAATKDFREQVYINTKFGHSKSGVDFSIEAIEKSIDSSLERLGTSYLDSVLLHNPPLEVLKGETDHEDEFKRLIELGKIRGYGVSIDSLEELDLTLNNLDVDVIEIMFNINHQEVTELFDEVKKRGIMLVVKVPLDSGWLTGKYNNDSVFGGIRSRWNRSDITHRAKLIEEIKEITGSADLVQYALSFILSFDEVTTVIPGVSSIKQLKENKDATNFKLDENVRKKLIQFGESIRNQNIPW